MKKVLSLLLFLISASGFAQAPIALPITWDDPVSYNYTFTDFGGNVSTIGIDPLNGSNTVLRVTKPAGSQVWAGTTMNGNGGINNGGFSPVMPFNATDRFISARIYTTKPVGTIIMAKIEDSNNGGIFVEKQVLSTVQNGWQNLVFDFGSGSQPINYSNSYGKLSFFFNFLTGGEATNNIYYLDNVAFGLPPVVASFSPTSETSGGTVVISGTGFTGASVVSFGGFPAASFSVINNTTISAVVGFGGSGAVSVTTPAMSADLAGFTFIPPATAPTISSFTPASGATGATITITGTNLAGVTAVNFGGTAAASFTVVNATTITAVVANGSSGSVAVTSPDGVDTKTGFTYVPPAPTITSFTPTTSGSGGFITITGTNFIDISAVTFGGTPASFFTVVNPTTITATVALGTSGSVVVTNAGGNGTKTGYVYKSQISLPINWESASVDYTTADFGNNISVQDVDPLNGANKVLKVSKPNGAEIWAGTTMGNGAFDAAGLASAIPFTNTDKLISARIYSPLAGMIILCKVENKLNGGISAETQVLTTVANGWQTMLFNLSGVNTANTYDKISFFFNFLTPGQPTNNVFYIDDIAFLPSPSVSSFLPTSAGTGTTVTITGTNFTGASAVSFGGQAATSFTVVNSTTITAVVGTGLSGDVSVTRGATANLAGFTYLSGVLAPHITSFTPTSGGQTDVITISGDHFTGSTIVRFGGTNASSFTVVNDNTITATVAAGASGTVSVISPDGVGSLAGFTFIGTSQIDLPITWNTPFTVDYATSDFGGNVSSLDVDPLNGANGVLKIVKNTGSQTWAGTTLGNGAVMSGGFATVIPFSPTNRFVSVRLYSPRPIGTIVLLKTEESSNPTQSVETQAVTTVQNGWQTLTFDFGNQSSGTPINYFGINYNKLSIFMNFGTTGTATANTFYVDDVIFVQGATITSFTPTSASTGQTVTIAGTNFVGATAVSFGNTPASSFIVVNNSTITAVVGAGASGSVRVTTSGIAALAGFDYVAPPGSPVVTSFLPTTGHPGDLITISGSNLNTATAVKFGATNAASYTIVNSSTITAIVGAGSTGSVGVTNSFGTGTRAGFTYVKNQPSLPIIWDDFATVNYTPGDFGGLVSVMTVDPSDASNSVMRATKGAGLGYYTGSTIGNGNMASSVPFSLGNTVVSVRLYSTMPVGHPMLLKFEGPDPAIEVRGYTTSSTGWQIINFDFSAVANFNHTYNKLVFFFGFEMNSFGPEVYYLDNIQFGQVPIFVWTGATSTNFNVGSNWSTGFPPSDCNTNVQIYRNTVNQPVVLSGTAACGNVNIQTDAKLTINSGATLSVCGNLTGSTLTNNGTIILNGTATQQLSGNHNYNNMTITKPAASGVVTVSGGTTKISGVLTLSNPTSSLVVSPSAKLILVSNATGTGSIAAIPAGASVTGDLTQQRYLPGTGDGWFFLGTPIQGGDFSQWTDNMLTYAGTNLGGNQGVIGLGMQHSTIFKYDDAFHNVTTDTAQKRGWRVPVLGDMLNPGQGFRVWLKSYNCPSRTIDNVGTVTQGDFSFPTLNRTEPANCQPNVSAATIACDESFRGWNFLANPYPSPLNWDGAGWTKPGAMLNSFYRWNSAGAGYGVYNGGGSYVGAGPAPANPNLIPSSQGFFVKLQGPGPGTGTLSITENAKASGASTFLRTAVADVDILKISLERPDLNGSYNYMGEIRFSSEATDGKDLHHDIPNFTGGRFYFTMPVEDEQMIVNTMGQLLETKTVSLNTRFMGSVGTHQFKLSGIETFAAGTTVYLRDNYLGTIHNMTFNPVYTFQVGTDNIGIADRFELVFSPDAVTGTKLALNGVEFSIYPNPTSGRQVTISTNGNLKSAVQVVVTDVLGKVVAKTDLSVENGISLKSLELNVAAGIYNVLIKSGSKTVAEKLVVR